MQHLAMSDVITHALIHCILVLVPESQGVAVVLRVKSHDIAGARRVHNKDSLLAGLVARLLRLPPTESLQVLIRWHVDQPFLATACLMLFPALDLEIVYRSMRVYEGAVIMLA
jgi:hypothetical protein